MEEEKMKKLIAALTVVAAVAVAGSAFARCGMGMGQGQGMGPGGCMMMGQGTAMTEQKKKFIAETMPLRDEMHAKHTALMKAKWARKAECADREWGREWDR